MFKNSTKLLNSAQEGLRTPQCLKKISITLFTVLWPTIIKSMIYNIVSYTKDIASYWLVKIVDMTTVFSISNYIYQAPLVL